MKKLIVSCLLFGLAVINLQAAPIIIKSGTAGVIPASGVGYHTAINSAPVLTGQPTLPAGAVLDTALTGVGIAGIHGGWSPPVGTSAWVSFMADNDPTASGHGAVACEPLCNDDYVTFYNDFTLSGFGGFGGSTLQVMADDTAAVWINDNRLIGAAGPYDPIGNTYNICSNVPVGCLTATTMATFDLAPYLHNGDNRLVFQVFQRNGSGFGLDYSASVVPEPGFYGVLALGLSGLWFGIRRKRSS